ncbi:TPA: hypothetical protein HA265_03910, partial [Candidatus Woesearchaeota archaeon]|nr:hypothetical protein [Candidatus Woesearchaeota archaeon]
MERDGTAHLIDFSNVRDFKGRDFIRITDYNRDEMMFIYEVARLIAKDARMNRSQKDRSWFSKLGKGLMGITNFGEPSSRTHDSSRVAMNLLGIDMPIERRSDAGTSASKGEALAHDMSIAQNYNIDVIVTRNSMEGAPQAVADYFDRHTELHDRHRPIIINGGDGSHDHPTQAGLDHLAMYLWHFVDIDGKPKVSDLSRDNVLTGISFYIIGDSLSGRTGISNAKELAKRCAGKGLNEVVLVGPKEIRMLDEQIDELKAMGLKVRTIDTVEEALEDAAEGSGIPVWYATRLQEERLPPQIVDKVRHSVYTSFDALARHGWLGNRQFKIMHPWPEKKTNRDIDPRLEDTPNWGVFEQMEMGPYFRAAIIGLATGIIPTREGYERWVDVRREKEKQPKYTVTEIKDGSEEKGLAYKLKKAIFEVKEPAVATLVGSIKKDLDPLKAVFAMIDYVFEHASAELLRMLTFRFVRGEDGTVADHFREGWVENGAYNLGVQKLQGTTGSDGKRTIISIVDGLESKRLAAAYRAVRGRVSDYMGKGVLKVRGHQIPPGEFYHLAAISHGLTVSHIKDGKVVAKYLINDPEFLVNFNHCSNKRCVTADEFSEPVPKIFYRSDDGRGWVCRNCDTYIPDKKLPGLLIKGK